MQVLADLPHAGVKIGNNDIPSRRCVLSDLADRSTNYYSHHRLTARIKWRLATAYYIEDDFLFLDMSYR